MKKKTNWFTKLILLLFIIFLGLFIASKSGFYEAKVSKNALMTNEAIKQFEQDIEEGKEVDIDKYIKEEKKDYANGFTRLADKITSISQDLLSGSIKDIWEFFKILF